MRDWRSLDGTFILVGAFAVISLLLITVKQADLLGWEPSESEMLSTLSTFSQREKGPQVPGLVGQAEEEPGDRQHAPEPSESEMQTSVGAPPGRRRHRAATAARASPPGARLEPSPARDTREGRRRRPPPPAQLRRPPNSTNSTFHEQQKEPQVPAGAAENEELGNLQPANKIFVQMVHHFTGGPEALLQLYLALGKASIGTNWDVKALSEVPHPTHVRDYPNWGTSRISKDAEVDARSVVIVPEIRRCADMKSRFPHAKTNFIYLLQGGPVTRRIAAAGGCSMLSHAYYIARPYTGNPIWIPGYEKIDLNLPEEYQLTPYVTPSLVKAAVEHTQMLRSGRIYVQKLATPKRNVVIIDNDARLLARGYEAAVKQTKSIVPDVQFVIATGMSRNALTQLMKDAKVVYDDCMVGSERVPMEACLFGAVVITNNCNVGLRFADVPSPLRLVGSPDSDVDQYVAEFVEVVVNALQNYENLLADFNPARLYFSNLGAESLADEAAVFLSKLK
jgi:hypothetical protein